MTKQETFKRRVRERMLKTGERYGAARRALLKPHGSTRREWVAQPEHSDAVIVEKTGRGWDDWVDLIDAGPGREAGHTAIAAWVNTVHGIPGWWAQNVTVSYERITGLRLPGQMADGTFTVSKSRIVHLERDALRAMLLDDADRADLIPGFDTELKSKPASKSLRFTLGREGADLGVVMFTVDDAPRDRIRVTVTHEKLPSLDESEPWRDFWGEWLDAVEELAAETPVTE